MTFHSSRNYSVLSAVAAAVLVLTACTKTSKEGVGARSATVAIPIGQPDMNLDSLRTQINALPMGEEHSRKRKLQGKNAATSVKIRPVGDSYEIDSASGPATPMIVAWIQNQNLVDATEDPVFKPKPQAQYLVQIYRDDVTHEAKYQLIEVPALSRGTVSVIKTGVLLPCHHPPKPHPDADFKTCTGINEYAPVASNGAPNTYAQMSMAGSFFRAASFLRSYFKAKSSFGQDPTWIACNAGCCTLAGT